MDKKIILGAAIIIIVLFAGLFTSLNGTGLFSLPAQEQVIKVGWAGPLTGGLASLGKANLQGIQIAISEINKKGGINGKKVGLLAEDTKGERAEAINIYQKLTKVNEVSVILSPSYSDELMLAPMAEKEKQIIINSVDTSDEIAAAGDWIFGIGVYDEGVGVTLSEFAYTKLNARKVAIIYDTTDAFFTLVKNGFEKNFSKIGGEITQQEGVSSEENDFRSILEKVKQEPVDAIVLLGYDNAGFAIKQAKELGINATFLGGDTVTTEIFQRNSNGAAEGMYFSFWETKNKELSEKFLAEFEKSFGGSPEMYLFSATGYDTMNIVEKAITKCAESDYTRQCIKEKLYETKNVSGLTGELTMSPDGIVRTVKEEIFVLDANLGYRKFGGGQS